MDTLHEVVTKELLARVRSGEATASELSVAVKFLKDNGASPQTHPTCLLYTSDAADE